MGRCWSALPIVVPAFLLGSASASSTSSIVCSLTSVTPGGRGWALQSAVGLWRLTGGVAGWNHAWEEARCFVLRFPLGARRDIQMINDDAHVLVVDDDIGIQRALQRSLSAYGYEVSAVSTGEEALEEIARERPDLVLLDLGLPGMSGLEVCEKIRAESNLPIIVLSIKNAEHDKVRALDLGADDYVSKPFG